MSRITRATIKSYIRKNGANLWISNRTDFDGMVDCVIPCGDPSFRPAVLVTGDERDTNTTHRLGVSGAWFVGSRGGGGDYFYPFSADGFTGYEVSNACGRFILAVKS